MPDKITADNLAGTGWILTKLNARPVIKGSTVTLNFDDGRAVGADGCNRYTAPYTADGARLEIRQPIASTRMACAEPIMVQGAAYMKALEQAAAYQVDAGRLTLYDGGGITLATFAAQSTDLAGTSWEVIAYNNGKQAVVSVSLGTTLTAVFAAGGKLTGNAGCNNYTATYETDGKNILIGPARTTRKTCAEPQNVMEQERLYLEALATAATVRIDGAKLELRTAEGALAAAFRRAE